MRVAASQVPMLLSETVAEFRRDKCFHLAAALSYYTLFSLAPMLVMVIAFAGLFFGREAVSGEVYSQLDHLLGHEGALGVQRMVESAYEPGTSFWATVLGAGTLLIGATTVFIQIQDALNSIWGVRPRPQAAGWRKMVLDRVLSFGLVLGVGFVLLVSLALQALLTAFAGYLSRLFPGADLALRACEAGIGLAVSSLLFAMMFKFLPDATVRWRDVAIGATATALLFAVGKVAIGAYLGRSDLASTYGAAAAVVIVILWVNYSSLILFFGAEFTQVFATRLGAGIRPRAYAVSTLEKPVVSPTAPPPPTVLDGRLLRTTLQLAALAAASKALARYVERRR